MIEGMKIILMKTIAMIKTVRYKLPRLPLRMPRSARKKDTLRS
jgi:hypothetical protein